MTIEKPITHPNPEVSVVIPTIPQNEVKTTFALEKQSIERFEVVIVNDDTLNRCEARNKGIKEANADIIAQTDDDCLPPENWVERIRNHFNRDSGLVLLEGPLDIFQTSPRHYIGANLAYRRDAALNIGGFNSEFAGWRADTDFGWRMEDEYGVNACQHDPALEITHYGPHRTKIDRKKERKFRTRYPTRYFTLLYPLPIPFGEKVGFLLAKTYTITPLVGEIFISIFLQVRPEPGD